MRYATVTFEIDTEHFGFNERDLKDEEVIDLLRRKLELQPFSWELNQYSLDETIGKDE